MKDVISFVDNNFNLSLKGEVISSYDELEGLLAQRIVFFIRTDMDKLMQILYRIDVDDRESSMAFDKGEIHSIAKELASLIIQRQIKKLNYAKGYMGD